MGLRGELTGRDLEIAHWLERLMGAGLEDVRVRFGLGRSQAYRRLQVLKQFGVIASQRMRVDLPAVYLSAGRSLRPTSFEHVLQVSRLVAASERAGRPIATEVELRRERAGEAALPQWLDEEARAVALASRRIPDAIEGLASGGLRAFEIELSSKGKARREAIPRQLRSFQVPGSHMVGSRSSARGADSPRDRRPGTGPIHGGQR